MTRPMCTGMMPGSHLQPFVRSLTKLCRHTTLVQQCLSNGHQHISQCLSYTQPEDGLKARAYSTPKSTQELVRIFKSSGKDTNTPSHPPAPMSWGWPKRIRFKKRDPKKTMNSRQKETLAISVCFYRSHGKSSATMGLSLKWHSP